jgi:hypothetical protein
MFNNKNWIKNEKDSEQPKHGGNRIDADKLDISRHNAGLDTLPFSEREGWNRGGEKFCDLFNFLRGSSGGNRGIYERDKQGNFQLVSKRQIKEIEDYLDKTGWLDIGDYEDEVIKHGGTIIRMEKVEGAEGMVFLQKLKGEKKIIKVIYWGTFMQEENPTPLDFLTNKIGLQNTIFPSVSYKLLGVDKLDNKLYFVMEQPYIKPNKTTDEEIEKDMLKRGFKKGKFGKYYSDNYIISDLHKGNVFKGIDGELYYIDPIISRKINNYVPV